MATKFDHELRLTRRRSPDMQNFEADLSMMVPRPYESILGGKTSKYDFSEVAKKFLVENWPRPGRDRIPAGRGSQTGGQGGQERAKEDQIRAI